MHAQKALKYYCDWLLAQQGRHNYFFSQWLEWHTNMYPVRTLLAGYKLLNRKEYLKSAVNCLDKYVDEQLPNGGWCDRFRNNPTSQLSNKEIRDILASGNINLADTGSNAAAVLCALPYVDAKRRKRYLKAAMKFADHWAPRWILPSGAIANGIWGGHAWRFPCSCSIGTEAMFFSALHGVTGKHKYLETASNAVKVQLKNYLKDGQIVWLPYNKREKAIIKPGNYVANYYANEGMIWVFHFSQDEALKAKIAGYLKTHLKGRKGLLSVWENDWFLWDPPLSRIPDHVINHIGGINPKAGGLPSVMLVYIREIENDPIVRTLVERGIRFLCNPEKASRIWGITGIIGSERGFGAVPATGFAGLSLAEYIEPGIIFRVK